MKIRKFVKNLIFIMCIILSIFISISCDNKINILESETRFVPEPANQFAIDKETEVETIEPTEAHHPYPENYKYKPGNEVVIGEREFLTKINYIYNHIDDFKDAKVIVEGMYAYYSSWDNTFNFPMVYRNGPSCHGDDQYGGFFLVNVDQNLFDTDDWVRVEGMPFMYEHTDSEGEIQKFLFLLVTKIDKLSIKERKAEMVNN